METNQLAKVLKALSHPNRLEIFLSIVRDDQCDFDTEGECRACDFMEKLGIGAPTVSHHLKELVNAGLVTTRRQGKFLVARGNPHLWEEVRRALFPDDQR